MQLDNRSLQNALGGQLRQAAGREGNPFRIVVSNPEDRRSLGEGSAVSQAGAPSTSRFDSWLQSVTAFLSMVLKQMIADFALSAAALHPEAHCLLNDSVADDRSAMTPSSRGSGKAPEARQELRHMQESPARKRGRSDFYLIPPQQRRQPLIPSSAKLADVARLQVVQADVVQAEQAQISGASIFVRLGTSIGRARKKRQMTAILEALDNRTLQDLGISRHEIKHVVKNGHHRNR